jgi:FkbM family methyltransferase
MAHYIFLKKLISKILINKLSGTVLASFYKKGLPFRGTIIKVPETVSPAITAMLFWRAYESAEIRFVNKYLDVDTSVIEIGGSIGGVSCQIGKKLNHNTKLICIEANPSLISALNYNLSTNNIRASVINKAIGKDTSIEFQISGNNLVGHAKSSDLNAVNDITIQNIQIATITLDDILSHHDLSRFNLVCDIEGAEIVILKESVSALKRANLMIFELHTTEYENTDYSVKDLVDIVEQLGFKTIDSYGNVYVFKNLN